VTSRARRGTVVKACLAGIALGAAVPAALPPRAYRQDLQQLYLVGRALHDGVDPFTPLPALAARYFPRPTDTFPHPSPYPPGLALVVSPLTVLPFPAITTAWLATNVALLVWIGRSLGWSARDALALAAWPPVWYLLQIGQLELLLLALLLLSWRSEHDGRELTAGVLLGTAVAIKPYLLLLLLPLAARRRTRALSGAALVVGMAQLATLAAVGPTGVARYYGDVLPHVGAFYSSTAINASPHGAFLRLFGGAVDVPPLVDRPALVLPLTVVASALGILALLRVGPRAAPLALLVALPAAWYYYVVLALPGIVALLRGTRPRLPVIAAAVAASAVMPVLRASVQVWTEFAGRSGPPPALLLAVQPLGIVALLVMSVRRAGDDRPA
jgi:hypothetical protein